MDQVKEQVKALSSNPSTWSENQLVQRKTV
jgi:hypothetical protein